MYKRQYQYYLVKCIIPIRIYTATTTEESCSCPHYHFIPIPAEYRGFYLHSRGNAAVIIPITAVITMVTAVLLPSPLHVILYLVK